MRFTIVAALTVIGLAAALPDQVAKRDRFEPCSNFGSNCATQDQSFCDSSTGKISVCHKFGSDCWIRFTQDACSTKREVKPEGPIEKRDKFDKCSVFGANCAIDGNEFCDGGHISVCEKVPFTNECWVRYTAKACASKRDVDVKPKPKRDALNAINRRDVFDKCSVFGSNCAVDGNEFCYNGVSSICHQVPFTDDCWVRYTASSC